MTSDDGAIDVSVIVPAYKRLGHLAATIDSLLAQSFSGRFEVIAVISADSEEALRAIPPLTQDPRLTVLTHAPRLTSAQARNEGSAAAGGRDLAFTDSDVIVGTGWIENLWRASQGAFLVAGSVANGTPQSSWGTAEYLTEFLDFHPSRPAASASHGALCNMFIPGSIWEREGPFEHDSLGGEDTVLSMRMKKEGLFRFVPEATVTHLNRTGFTEVFGHQIFMGRSAARLARGRAYKYSSLVRLTILAPVAVGGRMVSIYARALRWLPRHRLQTIGLFPFVLCLVLAWGIGVVREGWRMDLRALRAKLTRRGAAGDQPPSDARW